MIVVSYSDELYHHGIKGQKWGIRRYQNEDGTYTKSGRKRYGLDLDLNDKSLKNISKIRTGEARRRLDVAKNNNETNSTRIADLQGRLRSAKRNERNVKQIDKGSKLAAKGQTILGNKRKQYYVTAGAAFAGAALKSYMNQRAASLIKEGRYTQNHEAFKNLTLLSVGALLGAAEIGTAYKVAKDNKAIRAYEHSKWNGQATKSSVGSQEYKDRVKAKQGGR